MASDSYWGKISSCIRDSKVCAKMGRTVGGVPETADMFSLRKLSPVQVCSWLSVLFANINFHVKKKVSLLTKYTYTFFYYLVPFNELILIKI